MSIRHELLMTAEDSRRCPRVSVSLPIDVRIRRGAGPARHEGRIARLGSDGALIHLEAPCVRGDFLDLQFRSPALDDVMCEAIVRSCPDDGEVGIEFVRLSEVAQERIRSFVAQGHS